MAPNEKQRNLMMTGNPRTQPPELIPYFGYDNLMLGSILLQAPGKYGYSNLLLGRGG